MQVKLVNENYHYATEGKPGKIIIEDRNVFKKNCNNPEATYKEFTKDSWFKTGNIAVIEYGYYRILGTNYKQSWQKLR